jgi:zinc transport system substrate-binding protein
MKRILSTLGLLSALLLSGCAKSEPDDVRRPRKVSAVNYPLAYFAERIGGDEVDVRFPVPTGEDPDHWMPDAATIAEFQQADLILLNGAGYAKWTEKASLPLAKSCETAAGFRGLWLKADDVVTHSHGPAGKHTHGGPATITWLDFRQAATQASAVCSELARLLPESESRFRSRSRDLEAELMALDAELERIVAGGKNRLFVASHPVYHYWIRRTGLKVKSVHWEPDAVPNDEQMKELNAILTDHPAKVMIWEGEPVPGAVAKLKAIGIASVVFEPCGNRPASGDFLSVMKKNLDRIRPAFAP